MYAKISNGVVEQYPHTVGDLRRKNPRTSFPETVPDDILSEYGLVTVQKTPQPDADSLTHRVKETTPVRQAGAWVQQWTTEPYPDAADRIRAHRNRLLAETDYMALSDTTLTLEWATYRQALRDITEQQGFPLSVTWPVKPE